MELITPYTMVISGQTGSGKTHFVMNLIKEQNKMHDKPFDHIIIAFSMIQPAYLNLKLQNQNVLLVEGFPSKELDEICGGQKSCQNTLCVLDDLLIETENDPRIATLFTKMRHKNVSTIFLVQNFYFKSCLLYTSDAADD